MPQFTPGMLINARHRLWRVDSHQGDVLYATALDETSLQTRLYTPLERIEPGQLEQPDPTILGSVQAQDLMVQAYRLSMLNSTAPLLSLQRSRAIPVPYQLVPVVMALGQSPVRLLIADDIGLGKTIEAGLIISELLSRGLARRILVICPANLREQWQDALDYFFHINARFFSRTDRRALERDLPAGSNLLEFFPVFITSVDYAKSPEIKSQILEVPWDLVLIDEAHRVAKPHQNSPIHKVRMDRWDLAQALAKSPKIKHLLLLTATPHNGYTDTFASLLRLLDTGVVSGTDGAPVIHREIARRHIVQRRRRDVESWQADDKVFPTRDQKEEYITISSEEKAVIEAVSHYGDLILEHAQHAQAQIRTLAGWTVLHLHKRALSSPEALRQSLRNRRASLRRRLDNEVEEDPGLPFEAARDNVLDNDPGEQFDEEEIVDRSEKVVPGDAADLHAEFAALDELDALAARITPAKDAKLQHLFRNMLRPRLAQRHKLIIFTRYRDTMSYVADQIQKSDLFKHVTVITIHGGLNDAQRQEALGKFEQAKDAVLVATDAISEGVNLQRLASQMIHYELAWNPNRLEQRNGRIDRFGQPESEVYIRTLVMDETLDATILKVMVEKARRIQEDYGFMPPFFGDDLNIIDFIRGHKLALPQHMQLKLFEQVESEAELPDPYSEEQIKRIDSESFYGQTDINLLEIQVQMQQVQDSVGSPDDIRRFVMSSLSRLNCAVDENSDHTLHIVLRHPALMIPGFPAEISKATFDPELGNERRQVEVLDLGHPLVRALLDLFKRESLQPDPQGTPAHRYGRTATMLTRDAQEVTALYTLLVRFATRTNPVQILEDLLTVALPVYGDTALNLEASTRLTRAAPAPGTLRDADSTEALGEALNRPDLTVLLEAQIDGRRKTLMASRRTVRDTLGRHSGWMQGADTLDLASWDMLAVKILWPA